MGLDTPIINSFLLLMVAQMGPWLLYGLGIGYLIGSVPFGLVLTRAAGLGDIRSIGSGNIGATNVLRTGNKGLAIATLIFDGLKATFAVWLAAEWFGTAPAVAAGLGALIGHLYPVWLRFKGGKGVATYIGALLGLAPSAALVFIAIWIGMAALKRYSSLAALTAAAATPVVLILLKHPILAAVFSLMTVLVIWKHRSNIARLRAGSEPQIGRPDAASGGATSSAANAVG